MPKFINSTKTNSNYLDKYGKPIRNGDALYEAGGTTDVNTTTEELVLSATNTPDSDFWFVRTVFYASKTAASNRTQTAIAYNKDKPMMYRYYANGSWSEWKYGSVKERIIGQYEGYIWFSDGTLIQWGNISITPTAASTVTTVRITFNKSYTYSPFISAIPQVANPNMITFSVGAGSTAADTLTGMNIYMTRTNVVATSFRWLSIGYKEV